MTFKLNHLLPSVALLAPDLTAYAQTTPVFRDPKHPSSVRVNDLIFKLTLEEKAAQMLYNSKAIERLGIPVYNWWNEALHGVGWVDAATVGVSRSRRGVASRSSLRSRRPRPRWQCLHAQRPPHGVGGQSLTPSARHLVLGAPKPALAVLTIK